MLLVLVALLSIPMAWTAYQLNWIQQRHRFYDRFNVPHEYDILVATDGCPWSLRLFGEIPQYSLLVPRDRVDEAKRLFPEAYVSAAAPEELWKISNDPQKPK